MRTAGFGSAPTQDRRPTRAHSLRQSLLPLAYRDTPWSRGGRERPVRLRGPWWH
jgi:hypothetical protein